MLLLLLLGLAADVLDTEGLMNLVCYRSSQSAMNFLYFQPMFRLMNWNVRQIDCWFERNCNRSIVVMDVLGLFALAVAAVAAAGG